MKTLPLLTLFSISLLTMSNSCHKDNDATDEVCPSTIIAISPLPGLAAFSPACFGGTLANIGESKQYTINSAADYAAMFSCTPAPAIDFSTNTLLVGKTKTASGSFVASQQVQLTCSSYKYSVTLGDGVTTAVTETVYYALVPKIPTSAQVIFEIKGPK